MKVNRLCKLALVALVSIFAGTYLINCIPPAAETSSEEALLEASEKARQDSLRRTKCELYLSFAYSYYQNQDWKGAADNYRKMIGLGCEEEFSQDIFVYFGRSYQQMASHDPVYYDSALFVYLKGEQYLPDNMFLHKNIAYIYHIQGKINLEIREYEKMVDINPGDIELYRSLVKLYFSAKRYEDVLWAITEILITNPNDEQAINDRLIAFNKLGKDIITVQKEQWEKNPKNVRYGLEYAATLKDRLEYEKAIEIYTKVANLDPKNREAWESLGTLYSTLEKHNGAITAFTHIHNQIAPKDLNIIQQIARSYQMLSDFPNALLWSEKSIKTSGSSLAYKIRADVYYASADYCVGEKNVGFEDKLVYKLAYDDYRKALKMGEYSVKSRVDFLKEYLIPTKEDWFMNKYDEEGNERKIFRPKGSCYTWIKSEVKPD